MKKIVFGVSMINSLLGLTELVHKINNN